MKNLLIIPVVAILFLFSSCTKDKFVGDGPIVTQSLNVADFTGITTESSIDVNVIHGDVQTVTVTGYENLMDRLDLSVRNDILNVDLKNGNYSKLNLVIDIEIPTIRNLKTNASGNIKVGEFSLSNLDITIDGSGDVRIADGLTIAEKLKSNIKGSGDIRVTGTAASQEINIDGSGEYIGFDLVSNKCNVSINGSGDVEVFVNENLSVDVDGSGDTYFRGSPVISSSIDGSGEIFDAN